jgi:hypothetical protein
MKNTKNCSTCNKVDSNCLLLIHFMPYCFSSSSCTWYRGVSTSLSPSCLPSTLLHMVRCSPLSFLRTFHPSYCLVPFTPCILTCAKYHSVRYSPLPFLRTFHFTPCILTCAKYHSAVQLHRRCSKCHERTPCVNYLAVNGINILGTLR